MKINAAPIECDEFQIAILVANSRGGNQCVISRARRKAHPLKPAVDHPQHVQNARTVELKPNKILINAANHQPERQEPARVDAVADDAVGELRDAVQQTVRREKQPKLALRDAQRRPP